MKLKQLKEDDERFGHKKGDIFLVEDADHDPDKFTGVKVELKILDNAFYKCDLTKASVADLVTLAKALLDSQ